MVNQRTENTHQQVWLIVLIQNMSNYGKVDTEDTTNFQSVFEDVHIQYFSNRTAEK